MPTTDPSNATHRLAIACAALALIATAPVGAVTPEELAGDYAISAIEIDYGLVSPPPLDTGDFTQLRGYLGATGTILVFDYYGQIANGIEYEQEEEGRYTLSGSQLELTDAEGLTSGFGVAMPNADTVVITGRGYDDFQNLDFDFRYEFTREATYYNQAQVDAAIAEATDGLYTQEELDAAVQEALDAFEPKVIYQPVVIPLGE